MALLYLAEPMDQANKDHTANWKDWWVLAQQLGKRYNTYRPATAWDAGGGVDSRHERVNRIALECCDLLVAFLPPGVPTIGVPMEIQAAASAGKPVVVLTTVASYALAGLPGVTVTDSVYMAISTVEIMLLDRAPRSPDELRVVLRSGGQSPARAHDDDAGLDLHTAETMMIEPGHFVDVPTDVEQVQLPPGRWGMITGRSSTLRKLGLHVPMAVIDPGWRGPLYVGAWNLGIAPVKVEAGSRLAQLILLANATAGVPVVQADRVDDHPRGLSGFGSTGV